MEDTNSTYLINIETGFYRECPQRTGYDNMTRFWFQIDIKGNVNIKSQLSTFNTSYGVRIEAAIRDVLVINDNIPIPLYIIDMLKILLDKPKMCDCYIEYWVHMITAIKTLKTNLQTQTIKDKLDMQKDKLNNKIMLTYLTKTVNKLIKTKTSYNKLFKKYENLNNYKLKID